MTYLIYLFVVCLLVCTDQYTKSLAVAYIDEGQKIEVIKNFFNLTYVKNDGAGFSILEGQQTLLIFISLAASIGFTYLLLKAPKRKEYLYRISLLLIIGGAIGNLYDRVVFHYVVDFLDFYIFGYDFPVFNFADSCLTVGVILLTIYTMFLEDSHAKS